MKRNKITAVILSIVMSMSMMMPSFEVMADETSAPSETQKNESTEEKEPKATEKQVPKETEKQEPKETEKQESKETEKQEPKETEKQEPKETEKQEPKETEKQEPKETEKQEPKETEIQEPKETEKQEPKETEKQEPKETEKQEPKETEKQEPKDTEQTESEESDNQETDPQEITPDENQESESGTTDKRKAAFSYSGKFGDNLMWSFDEDGTLTISGSGNMPNFLMYNPSTPWKEFNNRIISVVILEGVTSIGIASFSGCKDLLSVSIPSSVSSINDEAFNNCSSLSNVDFSTGVTYIGPRAFQNCSSLTSIAIPNSVTSIWDNAFSGCTSLKNITIPDSVTTIKDYAFSGCKGLTSITYPKGLTTTGKGIFSECTCLEKVTIPSGVTVIGAEAFKNCSAITNISIPDSVTSIGYSAFSGCSSITFITIPSNVTEISGTFNGCSSLKSITVPHGVTTIGFFTFYGCSSLKSITIPNSVTVIGDYAFGDCTSLSNIIMHEGLTSIGERTFYNCSNLQKIIIPDSVTSIGYRAFDSCDALKYVVLNKKLYNEYIFDSSDIDYHYYYSVTYISNGGGTISGKTRTYGTEAVDLSIVPNSSFTIGKITWISSDKTIELTQNDDGKFIMPDADGNVTIKALFVVSGACGDGLKWALNGDGVLTISGSGEMFDWNSLTDVPWNEYRSIISSVSFSDGVTSIGKYAFQSCIRLDKVVIPDGVTFIGVDAFKDCANLNSIVLNKNSYNTDAFPNFPTKAFHYYYDVVFDQYDENDFITVSGKKRTYGTDVLELSITCKKYHVIDYVRLIYPTSSHSLTKKANNTWECRMPDSDNDARLFVSLSAVCGENLTWDMDYLDGNPILVISGTGKMYDFINANDAPWSEYKDDIIDIVFPDGLTSIGAHSFESFKSLTSVKIPDNVSSIGYAAFWSCIKLRSVVLNKNAYNLKAFTASSTISRIKFHYYYDVSYSNYGQGSVSGKTRVYGSEEIKLDISCKENHGILYMKLWCWNSDFDDDSDEEPYEIVLAEITVDSYENCVVKMPDSERDVVVETYFIYNGAPNTCGSNLTWTLDDAGTLTISGSGDMADFIGGGYAALGSEQDDCPWKNDRSKIKKVVFAGDITSIGNSAFEECRNLSSITIPSSVKRIGESAFVNCESLTSIAIPNSVTSIEQGAFVGCTGLTSFTLPEKITSISNYLLFGCSNITTVYYPNTITRIGHGAFDGCSSLTHFEIPEGVTFIGDTAFRDCNSLSNISIPASVTSIGEAAFSCCTSFTSIAIPNGITTLESTFEGCTNLVNVSIPNSVIMLDGTFSDCTSLVNISIPNSVKTIGGWTFYGCTGLTSLVIPSGVTSIGYGAFMGCTNIKTITIPQNVVSIAEDIFYDCASLTTVIISGNVSSIGDRSFKDCTNLKDFSFPSGVEVIGEEAFAGCKGLTNVTIPENVKSIGPEAFKECDNVEKVKLPDINVALGESSFADIPKLKSVVLNKSSYNEDAFIGYPTNIFHYYYDVTYSNDGHGTITGNQRSYGTDDLRFTVKPESGYIVDKVTLLCNGKTVELTADKDSSSTNGNRFVQNKAALVHAGRFFGINAEDTEVAYTYTMPDTNDGAEIKATFKKISFSVTVVEPVNGTASVNVNNATVGEVITITTSAATGYEVNTIKVNDTINYGNTFTMPAENVTVTVTFKKTTYNVTVSGSVNGSASTDKSSAVIDEVVKITVTPALGYEVDEIKVNEKAINGQEFTMGAGDATVTVTFKKIQYTITVSQTTNGTATVSKDKAGIGDEITIIATPDKGYYLSKVTVNGVVKDGTTFTMPTDNVTIELEFSEQFNNTLTAKGGKTAKVKYKKLRKKAQTVARAKVMSVSNAQGNVKYSLVAVKRGKSKKYKKYFKINATTGNVTVKKKLKKGTYTITCRVTAAGDVEHKGVTKTVSFKVKVK